MNIKEKIKYPTFTGETWMLIEQRKYGRIHKSGMVNGMKLLGKDRFQDNSLHGTLPREKYEGSFCHNDKSQSEQKIPTLLEQIPPALSPALLGEEGYRRLAIVASLLPLELSSYFGFECHLGQQE